MEREWYSNIRKNNWEFLLTPGIYFGIKVSQHMRTRTLSIGCYWLFWGGECTFKLKFKR